MDTSKNYIKMCEEAEELQEKYIPQAGDFAVRSCELGYKTEPKVGLVSWNRNQGIEQLRWRILEEEDGITLDYENSQNNWLQKLVCLFRQDQLQNVMLDKVSSFRELSFYYNQWLNALDWQEYFKIFTSMEQLWLAFVMKEKFNKIWSGLMGWIDEKQSEVGKGVGI